MRVQESLDPAPLVYALELKGECQEMFKKWILSKCGWWLLVPDSRRQNAGPLGMPVKSLFQRNVFCFHGSLFSQAIVLEWSGHTSEANG